LLIKKANKFKKKLVVIGLILIFLVGIFGVVNAENNGPLVLLTWVENPQESQMITWISQENYEEYHLQYIVNTESEEKKEWSKIKPEKKNFEEGDNWIYTASLNGLKPGQEYKAQIYLKNKKVKEFTFKTLPEKGKITFIAGADSRTERGEREMRREIRRRINSKASEDNPDFVVFGGDYIQNAKNNEQWNWWLEDWDELMVNSNRKIPIVPAIGNHEVEGGYLGEKEDASYYYNYFNLPGNEKYYDLEISSELVLITLDSDHTSEIEGEQTEWLKKTLKEHQDKKWIIVQYHLPAWRSRKAFFGIHSIKIREYWLPLFEEYGVDVVLEADDHTFKISEYLKINSISASLQEKLTEGMKKAERNFDPEKDYSPWSNSTLQSISSGEWKEDFDNIDVAMEELIFQLALFQKQNDTFTKNNILNEVLKTKLYPKYWNSKIENNGYENYIDKEDGIIYLGDGGWGAPLRKPHYAEETWYLKNSASAYNYFIITLNKGGDELVIKPRLVGPLELNIRK